MDANILQGNLWNTVPGPGTRRWSFPGPSIRLDFKAGVRSAMD